MPKTLRGFLTALIALLTLYACSLVPSSIQEAELDRLAERARRVTIIRDDFGVPHVSGKTDAETLSP